MEFTLSGWMWSAQEAAEWGMANRVVGEGEGVVVREAVALAVEIAGKSQIAVQAQKEAVNAGMLLCFFFYYAAFGLIRCVCAWPLAYEKRLSEGLRTERRLFHMTFATKDQREGTHNIFSWF